MTEMQVVHALPDRIRLKVPAVRNVLTAKRFEKRAGEVEGIHWVRTNARCAGLVVRFDSAVLSGREVVAVLRDCVAQGEM